MKPSPDLLALAKSVALREAVPAELLRKIVTIESRWDPNARSPSGARGLTQLTGVAMKDVFISNPAGLVWSGTSLANPLDPEANLRCGARYLLQVARYIDVDPTLPQRWHDIYVAYNIGPTAARSVFSGRPQDAARLIALQAFGTPDVYYANVQRAIAMA